MTREYYYEILNNMVEQLGATEILETIVDVLDLNQLQDLVEGLDEELFEGTFTQNTEDEEWGGITMTLRVNLMRNE